MDYPPLLKDPFRFFFPLGWFAGVLGVGLWLPLALGDFDLYPVLAHRFVMVGGFLLAFVTGFLATAIPRFTSSWHLQKWEMLLLSTGLIGAIGSAISTFPSVHHFFVFLTITVLIIFATRRFVNRDENPPFTFLFVGAGLVLWGSASLVLLFHSFQPLSSTLHGPARALYIHGALLCLVIGVGGRLIPGILGWKEIVLDQRSRYENTPSYGSSIPASLWVALIVFLASYGFEGQLDVQYLWLMRAGVLLYVAVQYWNIYRPPKERTGFTWGIWIACWSFVIGMIIPVIWPSGGVHGIHMVFIGGFSLLTILVATRVTLAHGTGGMQLESSSRILKVFIGLFVVSMFTRVTSILWPRVYDSHLGYAALLWIVGIVLWAYLFIPRMIGDFQAQEKSG